MSLKSKAIYTALYKVLNLLAGFVTQFILTPIILNGLGRQLYGVYTIISKTEGYLSFIDLRPSAILRYKLAVLQGKQDQKEKKQYVGASLSLSLFTLPIILIAGLVLAHFFPLIFNIEEQYIKISQISVVIISAFLAVKSFLGIPEAILRGNNLEYKGFYIEPLRYLIYGILVVIFLSWNLSLIGIIVAIVLSFIFGFFLRVILQNKYCPGFSPIKPERGHIKEFLSNGTWYLASSVGTQALNSFDIILIGILGSPEKVTSYALTKAILFRIGEATVTVIGSITAGVGDLISRNDVHKIMTLRKLVIRFSLITGLSLAAYFASFNESFVTLWVDSTNYAGNDLTIVLCIALVFLVLAMAEEIFINAMLLFKSKSNLVLQSALIALVISVVFYSRLEYYAIAAALVISKLYQLVRYSIKLNNSFPVKANTILKENSNVILIVLYAVLFIAIKKNIQIDSWFDFIGISLLYLSGLLAIIYFGILNKIERGEFKARIKNFFNEKL